MCGIEGNMDFTQINRNAGAVHNSTCDHSWKPTGMFLMKMADTHNAQGYTTGRQVVGGLNGYLDYRTPEVEWCERCGLLRIPVPS